MNDFSDPFRWLFYWPNSTSRIAPFYKVWTISSAAAMLAKVQQAFCCESAPDMTTLRENQLTKELQLQLAVTQAMLMQPDLDPILHSILTCITHREGLGINRVFLFLARPDGKELYVASAMGPFNESKAKRIGKQTAGQQLSASYLLESFEASLKDPSAHAWAQRLAGFVVPLAASQPSAFDESEDVLVQALIARCAASKEPFVSNTIRAIYQPPPAGGGEVLTFTNLAVVPLVNNEVMLGAILVDNSYDKHPIGNEQLPSLSVLGNLAAISIDRAKVQQRYKEMLSLDGLTGVLNRRHFELRITQETTRATLGGRPLSLLLIDIDHFRECNQRHGYECGDLILKELAAMLRERVRSEDLVARFGGEKFAILLTGGATVEESGRVAEKLRSQIAARVFDGCLASEITVSIGVSWLSAGQLDATRLFQVANETLVQAKQKGRDQVILADH